MISYFLQDTDFRLPAKMFNRKWLTKAIHAENRRVGEINIIFCSDASILEANRQYLNHDFYTDIITFDFCYSDILCGDLYIGVEEVRRNSVDFSTDFDEELARVMVHGILHLVGYDDHTDEEKIVMRSKEEEYLSLRRKMIEDAK